MVGYHGHAKTGPKDWERAFSLAKYNGANVDIGHFVAGNNTSPLPFIKQYHDRVTHIHVKDRKMHDGPNVPFGEGDTPWKKLLDAAERTGGAEYYLIEQEGSRFPSIVTAEKCLENYHKLRPRA